MRAEGHVGRLAAIDRHVAKINSGKPHLVKAGQRGLNAMNLSWGEHDHVNSKLNRAFPEPKPLHLKHEHGSGFGTLEHAASVAYHASPFPAAIDAFKHPGEFVGKDQARVEANNRRQAKDFSKAAEATVGYKEIEHIRQHPIAGGIAIAGLVPGIGKFGKVLELGVDASRGVNAAEHAATVAKAAEEARGLKKIVLARRAARLARRGAARNDEAAIAHVAEVSKRARQQGFGRVLPKVSGLKPGEVTPETGGEAGKIIRQGLNPNLKGLGKYEKVGAKLDNPGIGALRAQQEEIRAVERSSRAGAIEKASAGKSGLTRHIAAKRALEGKLPARIFNGFKGLTPELRDRAINHIYDHPHFQPYEKVRAVDALDEAIAGKVPTKGDQKLLERAFGKESADGIMASLKSGGKENAIANILNVPRSLMASGDISAPFRQGLVVAASHPRLFASNLAPMLKSLKSEDAFQSLMKGIHEDPVFPLAEKAKLALTDIGETAKSGVANLSQREEQFTSNLAEQLPGVGHIVRGSDRAYVGFLNKTRFDLFHQLVHQAASDGYHLNDKLVEDIAKFVNSATGRGDMGKLADHTATLNALFFSPRLLASRLNFMNPVYYARMDPFARHQAIRAATRLVGTLMTILGAAKMAGAQVGTDPRNADFAKIRIGNTRIDIAGGFQQPIRLFAQLITGEIVSSTTGKKEYLNGGFAGSSRFDVLTQFAKGKLAPVPGLVTDVLSGQQFSGGPLDWSLNPLDTNSEITSHYLPLSWQDAISTAQQTHSIPAGVGGGMLASTGIGIQSYSAKKKKAKARSSGRGYGGGSGYGGSSGYGSSSGSSGYGSNSGYGP